MSIAPCVVAKAILARVRSKLVFWFYFETGNGVDAKKRPVKLIDTEYYARDGVTRLENRLEQYLQQQYERRERQAAQEQEQEEEVGRELMADESWKSMVGSLEDALKDGKWSAIYESDKSERQAGVLWGALAAASASRVRALGAGLRHTRDWEAKARRKADYAIDSRLLALQSLPSSSWLLIGLLHVSGGIFQCH